MGPNCPTRLKTNKKHTSPGDRKTSEAGRVAGKTRRGQVNPAGCLPGPARCPASTPARPGPLPPVGLGLSLELGVPQLQTSPPGTQGRLGVTHTPYTHAHARVHVCTYHMRTQMRVYAFQKNPFEAMPSPQKDLRWGSPSRVFGRDMGAYLNFPLSHRKTNTNADLPR